MRACRGEMKRPLSEWKEALQWCAMTGSNRRPTGCKPVALPAELTARVASRVAELSWEAKTAAGWVTQLIPAEDAYPRMLTGPRCLPQDAYFSSAVAGTAGGSSRSKRLGVSI